MLMKMPFPHCIRENTHTIHFSFNKAIFFCSFIRSFVKIDAFCLMLPCYYQNAPLRMKTFHLVLVSVLVCLYLFVSITHTCTIYSIYRLSWEFFLDWTKCNYKEIYAIITGYVAFQFRLICKL